MNDPRRLFGLEDQVVRSHLGVVSGRKTASRSKRADRATVENTFNFRVENAFDEAVQDVVPEGHQDEFLTHVRLSTDLSWAEDINKKITSTVKSLYEDWVETQSEGLSDEGRFPESGDDLDLPDEDFGLEEGFDGGEDSVVDLPDEDFGDETVIPDPDLSRPLKKKG